MLPPRFRLRLIEIMPWWKEKFSLINFRISASGIFPVPYVSTDTESGSGTPMAYETYTR
jgi:hypothetical protein